MQQWPTFINRSVRRILPILLFCFSCQLYGNDYVHFSEDSLLVLFRDLAAADTPVLREKINASIIDIFGSALTLPESFDHPYDSLFSLGKVNSADSLVRIITWSYSDTPSDHKYFGYIQLRNEDRSELSLYFLKEEEHSGHEFDDAVFCHTKWYGALYYQVHTVYYDNKTYYTLIGFDFNNLLTNKKMVDVLTFQDGVPRFGAPVFHLPDGIKSRIEFEYSSRVVMLLRYFPERDMIIYDHLSPSSPTLAGQYRYYGPDMSYDALRFERGGWVHKSDIDWKQ